MKLIVRSLVVTLAFVGATAGSYAKAPVAKPSKASAMPVPTCSPYDPTLDPNDPCGFNDW